MPAKLTHKFVEGEIEKHGYKIRGGYKYVNSYTKIPLICPEGHEIQMKWANFQSGKRCGICSIKKVADSRRLSHEFVKGEFEKRGWTLLDIYKNSKTEMAVICPKGHATKMAWGHFREGRKCKVCIGRHVPIEKIRTAFSKIGWTLLDDKYINANHKMNFICDNGHKHKISWSQFKIGVRCGKCYRKNYTIEDMKKIMEPEGIIVKSKEYKNGATKLDLVCPEGHNYQMTWNDHRSGYRCGVCKLAGGMIETSYDYYSHKIDFVDKTRRSPENKDVLEVACKMCGKWFMPSKKNVAIRIRAINTGKGELHLYCSDTCKNSCSIYGRRDFPKGFKIYREYRQNQRNFRDKTLLCNDGHCEKCGKSFSEIEPYAHHEEPYALTKNNDDPGIGLCLDCHQEIHRLPWCTSQAITNLSDNK